MKSDVRLDAKRPLRVDVSEIGTFDVEVDVVVAGFGYAGAVAAIEAHDAGMRVLLAEKMPDPGGISILAGGAWRFAHDADQAFSYLKATNDGRTPDSVLRVLADGMTEIDAYIRKLAAAIDAQVTEHTGVDAGGKGGGNYPFPGWETFDNNHIEGIPNFDPMAAYPQIYLRSPTSRGPLLFRLVEHHVRERRIDVRLNSPVARLVTGPGNVVYGAVLATPDGELAVKAKRGVILACGGFEADDSMKQQYWQVKPVRSAAFLGNTGDGVRMAQALGADLWHMWHFHGSYGFRHYDPDYPLALRVKRLPDWRPGLKHLMNVKMCWIVVDSRGRRYMNECEPYVQDTGHRPMHAFDTETMGFPRLPSFLILDEEGRKMYPLGDGKSNDRRYRYVWSPDNTEEIKNGILKQANSIAELAGKIGVDTAALEASIARWNKLCANGEDADFGRPPASMMPIRTPPFLAGEVWPVVSNTQGGPVHNARQQILDPSGRAISRLYAAGELGSSFGYLYLSGANIAECFITGWIAGREAASLPPWDARANG
ncbi:MAG TPA: FAD-dependent oxidoreductase [Stellaceae bacterium]|nr:FAD-dependent oxidoreductase [Stellaceae bacterium]